jgi:hypothetical protein
MTLIGDGKPIGPFMPDDHLLAGSTIGMDDQETRLAAVLIRRLGNKHDCTAAGRTHCWHRHHRRDVNGMLEVLATLGLPATVPKVTADDYRLPGERTTECSQATEGSPLRHGS